MLGCPEVRDGSLYSNDRPGLGVDMDEQLAATYLCTDEVIGWTQTCLTDGSPTRPSLQRMNT
jgi:mannonate dehydratase